MTTMYNTYEKCMAAVRRCKMKSKNPLFTRYDLEFDHIQNISKVYVTRPNKIYNVEIFKLTLYHD